MMRSVINTILEGYGEYSEKGEYVLHKEIQNEDALLI